MKREGEMIEGEEEERREKVSSERKHGDENTMENREKWKLVEKQMSEVRKPTWEREQE